MPHKTIAGSVTAMVTPFTAGGAEVDEPALRRLVDQLVADGSDALLPCGGTGEFAALTIEERRRVLEVVADQNAGRIAILAHTGALFTAEAIRLSQHAESLGVDALMVSTPFYETLSPAEAKTYYAAVADAVDTPICLYNYPNATGLNLSPDLVAEFAGEIEKVAYVKDSAADLGQLTTTMLEGKVSALNGEDVLLGATLALGVDGVVVGTSNFMGPVIARMVAAAKAGKNDELVSLWQVATPLIQVCATTPYAAAMKFALGYLGHPVGEVRAPGRSLTAAEQARLTTAIDAVPADFLTARA